MPDRSTHTEPSDSADWPTASARYDAALASANACARECVYFLLAGQPGIAREMAEKSVAHQDRAHKLMQQLLPAAERILAGGVA